jgi:hypothetical protein
MMIVIVHIKSLYQKNIKVKSVANMSKEANIKNQNKLKVYLEKTKKNDLTSNSKANNGIRKQPRAN